MDVKLDGENMTVIVTKAIFDSITAEARDKLVQDSLKAMFEKSKDGYNGYNSQTKLQQAFEAAAYNVAHRIIQENLAKDEAFKAGVEAMLNDVVAKLFDSEARGPIVDKMASGIASALSSWR